MSKPRNRSSVIVARLLESEGFTAYTAMQVVHYSRRITPLRIQQRYERASKAAKQVLRGLDEGSKAVVGKFINHQMRIAMDCGLRIGLAAHAELNDKEVELWPQSRDQPRRDDSFDSGFKPTIGEDLTYSKDYLRASHSFVRGNKLSLADSNRAACCYCRGEYPASYVKEFTDGDSGICPRCSVDAVIGDASNLPIEDATFLHAMHDMWFEPKGQVSDSSAPSHVDDDRDDYISRKCRSVLD